MIEMESLLEMLDILQKKGGAPPLRVVSPDEYDVLLEMAKEDKLHQSGHVKLEHLAEYHRRLEVKRSSKF